MTSYEIAYRDPSGFLVGNIWKECRSDKEAAVFAHAMKFDGPVHIEVWNADDLVYRRPILAGHAFRWNEDRPLSNG